MEHKGYIAGKNLYRQFHAPILKPSALCLGRLIFSNLQGTALLFWQGIIAGACCETCW